ncbi:MAG: geranylgeranylglycerol-phosphate geranylgeranyltransferase [Bacteroidetes bacterium]|nr:geranylgeranylglycerol-phosphate geranylgeranyltransferase [Bacteroidota bacterium]
MFSAILRLIRFQNLGIIVLTQALMYFFIIVPFAQKNGIILSMDIRELILVVLSTVLIAAGGYIINDYFDIRIDRINRPLKVIVDSFIERRIAIAAHIVITALALLIAGLVAYKTGKLWLGILQVISAGLLWFYSTDLKYRFLAGNLAIAFLTALVPMLVLFYSFTFDFYDGINLLKPSLIITGFSFFAFLATVVREITKDIEDYEGDKVYGCRTLPVRFGMQKSRIFAVILTLLIIGMLGMVQSFFLESGKMYHVAYLFILLQIPFLIFIYRLMKAKTPAGFHSVNTLLKLIMLAGLFFALTYSGQV